MTTYTVIWKTTETAQLFTDEVVIDARLDEEIKELQNYEPLTIRFFATPTLESSSTCLGDLIMIRGANIST